MYRTFNFKNGQVYMALAMAHILCGFIAITDAFISISVDDKDTIFVDEDVDGMNSLLVKMRDSHVVIDYMINHLLLTTKFDECVIMCRDICQRLADEFGVPLVTLADSDGDVNFLIEPHIDFCHLAEYVMSCDGIDRCIIITVIGARGTWHLV